MEQKKELKVQTAKNSRDKTEQISETRFFFFTHLTCEVLNFFFFCIKVQGCVKRIRVILLPFYCLILWTVLNPHAPFPTFTVFPNSALGCHKFYVVNVQIRPVVDERCLWWQMAALYNSPEANLKLAYLMLQARYTDLLINRTYGHRGLT